MNFSKGINLLLNLSNEMLLNFILINISFYWARFLKYILIILNESKRQF